MKNTRHKIIFFSISVLTLIGIFFFAGSDNAVFAEVDCEGIAITASSAGDCSVGCTTTYSGASGDYAAPPASGFKGKANSCSSSGNCCCTGGSVPAPAVASCVSGVSGAGSGGSGGGAGSGTGGSGGAGVIGTGAGVGLIAGGASIAATGLTNIITGGAVPKDSCRVIK